MSASKSQPASSGPAELAAIMQKPNSVKWPARWCGGGMPLVSAFIAPENPLPATAAMPAATKTLAVAGNHG